MTQVLLELARSLQLKMCAHFHNSLIFLQRENLSMDNAHRILGTVRGLPNT